MKANSIYFLLLITLMLGCKSEHQKLLNSVSGDYIITKATFTNTMKVNSVVVNAGSISFNRCKVGSGGCEGAYELVGYPKVIFRYDVNELSYAIMINTPNPAENAEGSLKFTIYSDFNIIEKTSSTLVLYEGNAYNEDTKASYSVNLELKRK